MSFHASWPPLFGRKWSLTVKGPLQPNGSQNVLILGADNTSENLRVRFDIQTRFMRSAWLANIEIWNPNESVANFLLSQGSTTGGSAPPTVPASTPAQPLQQGMEVALSAGYQTTGQYGVIWDGFVLQPLFDRVNQTDFVVTLHCIIGLDELGRNFLGRVYGGAQLNQMELVQQMAADCYHPISPGFIAPGLAKNTLSRAKVVFGTPSKFFDEIASSNNMSFFLGARGLLNIGDLGAENNFPTAPKYTFSGVPDAKADGLIVGTPQQTQFGVNCRLLLNPNVVVGNPLMAIRIDNTVIQQLQRSPGQVPESWSILQQDGVYVVVGARYIGDTRGQEWYTDVEGWLTSYDKVAAIAAATGTPLFNN